MAFAEDLAQARSGDSAAFSRLVTPLEGMVWRVCYQLTGNAEDARDAAQETMLKAWRSLASFREEAAFSTWLYRIAVNVCRDALRRQSVRQAESLEALREGGFDPPDPAPGTESRVLSAESVRELRQAMSRLPEEQRVPLVLFGVEGQSYEEIASLTGVPVGTVKSRVSRARTKLLALLQNSGNLSAAPASKKVKGGHEA